MSEVELQEKTNLKSTPSILAQLPDIPIPSIRCAMRLQQRIDLLFLAMEAFQLGSSEYILATAKELGLQEIIKNRLVLWRLRCSNPWRKCYTREQLTIEQAKSFVILASYGAKKLMVLIRQLIIAQQQMQAKNMPLDTNFQVSFYLERFSAHFRARMNPNRAKVSIYLSDPDELNNLAMSLLTELLFCSSAKGMERYWISLFDGEVA
jgi:hypothetical protein